MGKLIDLIKEIDKISILYRDSDDLDARKSYNQYIELIILEAEPTEQYKLCDHWDKNKLADYEGKNVY